MLFMLVVASLGEETPEYDLLSQPHPNNRDQNNDMAVREPFGQLNELNHSPLAYLFLMRD